MNQTLLKSGDYVRRRRLYDSKIGLIYSVTESSASLIFSSAQIEGKYADWAIVYDPEETLELVTDPVELAATKLLYGI